MSIPIDCLYRYINITCRRKFKDPVIIYRFIPNGSKNIQDLHPLLPIENWFNFVTSPAIWCNDQEPLTHQWHSDKVRHIDNTWTQLCKSIGIYNAPRNLNYHKNIFKKNLLLHSEKRSVEVDKYLTDGSLIPVYYWSHALIARDWFRYAEHENFDKNTIKQFLIYNRAWSGVREYRLKFSDMLIEHGLVKHCFTWHNPIDDAKHYKDHIFRNQAWSPKHVLEDHFQTSETTADFSADFSVKDYQSTKIEVVLETLFDDTRLHLTEKSLRPIACRHPFILLAPHGSLQYLRNYGFKTFDKVWDESYDQIENPIDRMNAVIKLMHDILRWSNQQQTNNQNLIDQITLHNRNLFFSKNFHDRIINELETNLNTAFDQILHDPGFDIWNNRWTYILEKHKEIHDYLDSNTNIIYPTRAQLLAVSDYINKFEKNTTINI